MQLLAITLLAAAVTTTTLAVPHNSHHQRDLHRHIARDLAKSMRARNVLAADSKLKKRCKVRPISSSALNVPPTSAAAGYPSSEAPAPSSSAVPTTTAAETTTDVPETTTDAPETTTDAPETTTDAPEPTSTSTSTSAAPSATGTSIWKLKNSSSGDSFFDDWTFFAYDDPTDGTVDYQTSDGAHSAGLVSVNDAGNTIIKVDTTQTVTGNRKSVRIHHNTVFNGGLLVLDAVHMPTGCATWPAFWANGPNWPNQGEIDIIEGVNTQIYNLGSIHTASGCNIPTDFGASSILQGGTNCASAETGNGGCGQKMTAKGAFGADFNTQGGGVYAMKWDDSGISIYYFARGAIPADLEAGVPNPDAWGTPSAQWPSTLCNPAKFFIDNFAIINTTLCGQWASPAWADSCKASTGFDTCEAFVRAKGDQFGEAFWEIKSFKLYQS